MYLYKKTGNTIAGFSGSEGVRSSERVTQSDPFTCCLLSDALTCCTFSQQRQSSSCSGTGPCVLYHSCFIYIQLPLFFIPYCNLSRATYILYIAVYYFITKLCCRKYMRNLRQNACTGSGSTTQSDALTCMGFVSEFVSERVTQSDPLTCYITLIINYQL